MISAPTMVWVLTFSNSSGVSRPGLFMMWSGTPSLPMSCNRAAARKASSSSPLNPISLAISMA